MELYLHIGTNKTASSFLQTLMVTNAKLLAQCGYYIPTSKYDDEMKRGSITPGNGADLAWAIHDKNVNSIKQILTKSFVEAKGEGLDKVLISNEIIVRLFSDKDCLDSFSQSVKELNITKVKLIVFVRDLLGHSRSLYLHRSKSGDNFDIQNWFETDYETLCLTDQFLKLYKQYNFEISFASFNSNTLVKNFFDVFLEVDSKSLQIPNLSVNKSLGLNETRVLQTAKILSRLNTHLLYSKLLKLDTTANEELEKQFKVEAASYFKNHIKTIQFIEDEIGFKISEKIDFNQADFSSNSKPTIYLTEEHLNVIKQSQYSYLTSLLHDFRTKLKPKSNKFNTKRYGGNLRP